jgi:hypothetical protein
VGDGEGLGDEVASWSGSQDLLLDVVAAFATEALAVTARPTPEVSRTLPATSVTVAGRACPKRMKRPYPVLLVTATEPPSDHPLHPKRPAGANRSPTRLAAIITVLA